METENGKLDWGDGPKAEIKLKLEIALTKEVSRD